MVGRTVPVGRACLLLLTLLLAGCLGGGGKTEPVDAVDGTDAMMPDPAPAADDATPEPRPFEWEGRVPTGANGCTSRLCIRSGAASQEHRLLNITGGNLTLTWDTGSELNLKVQPCTRSCEHETSGTSPLTLDIPWLSPETEHVLVVEHVPHDVFSGMRIGPETPFRVEGTLMVV